MVKGSTTPYLAEFPISLRLRGSLDSMLKFLKELQGSNLFLPVSSFEIFAMPPERIVGGADGVLSSGVLYFNFVCSSFLPLPK